MNHIGMTTDGGFTSLMKASSSGHADIVRALIEADPSPKHIQMKVLGGTMLTEFTWLMGWERVCARVCGRVFMHRA